MEEPCQWRKSSVVKEQSVALEDGEIVGYRVDLKVTFLLD
jgi:flavin-binding protein dodecin